MLLEFGRATLIEKARQQPDKVRMVINKVKADGLLPAIESIRAKLDQPLALGYCHAGVVTELGDGIAGFSIGDRVASNGPHAEMVSVPRNLCARVPDSVSDDAAAFTVMGAIALEAIRLAAPTIGEYFVVTGLGLIGQLTAQLLLAHGCSVLGIDLDTRRLAIAESFGVQTVDLSRRGDPVSAAENFSHGRGVDAVIITAASRSSEPVHQAALMCRKRGRIVLAGVTGLELSRDDFYKKELSFQVSCSYGPGRYDSAYEEGGQDYPLPYVRWTAQRNFEAVLKLMAEGKLNVAPLITHRFPFDRVDEAYEIILRGKPHLGILLDYPDQPADALVSRTIPVSRPARKIPVRGRPSVALIGAGRHAVRMLLPAIRDSGARLHTIVDTNGVSAAHAARKFGFDAASTDGAATLRDPGIDTVFIATRHHSHAELVCESLRNRKNVFVEKPLAIRPDELENIIAAAQAGQGILMVGFNRRFAPHILKINDLLQTTREPKAMVLTVNAGAIPAEDWTQDPHRSGGRILGEACHFIDLLRFLAGSSIASCRSTRVSCDTATITLEFKNGSSGTVHYFSNGHKAFPKERLEIFCGGRVLQLDNFRRLKSYGWRGLRTMNLWRQDKGHSAAVNAFLAAVRDGNACPIPLEELIEVTRTTFQVA